MNILLVYPESPTTFWSFKHALKFINKKANLPPLGLLTVASMLPKDWNLKLVDMNIRKLKSKDIFWADFVFISAMNIQKESARNVINRCKDLGTKTVAGGPLFTVDFESFNDVDHLLFYEAEVCLPKFIDDLKTGSAKHKYDHKYDKKEYPQLTKTPIPAWELINMKEYEIMSLQYSRGCPFHCEFCNVVSLFGHTQRSKTAVQIIDELDAIYNSGWRGSVFFVDDNFIGNKRKLKTEILPQIISWMRERNYPFDFNTETSINIADDDELMELLAEAGFDCVFIGIETIDEDCLAECNKTQNKERDLILNIMRIQNHGIQVQGGFILGFDNDKPSVFTNIFGFIQNSGIVTAMVGVLTALKGTKLFDRLKKEERLLGDFATSNTDINFVTKMPLSDLLDGYKSVIGSIYAPKNYYKRVRLFLENYRPKNYRRNKIGISHISAFFKACILLGLFSDGRREFWKLLGWSLLKKGQAFAMSV